MATFDVTLTRKVEMYYTVTVTAASEDEARAKGLERASNARTSQWKVEEDCLENDFVVDDVVRL